MVHSDLPRWMASRATRSRHACAYLQRRASGRAACNLWHKAEADFATWLVMAKLGGFDDLPSSAQCFLTNDRTDPRQWSSPSHGPGRSRGVQRYYGGAEP